jgi:pimeloyl-ACP methyl ester carboxylesterase
LFDIDTVLANILAPGNLVSEKRIVKIESRNKNIITLTIQYPIQPYPFIETDRIKEIKFESKLLTDFYQTPTFITGAVILPENYYQDRNKEYPVVFTLPGWGGNRFHIVMGDFQQRRYGMSSKYGDEKIFIFLDQECRYGYHVFANSDNNGPRGDSFVNELIPFIEKRYRTHKKRFLIGQSSGAWAALWLQVNYPDYFEGCWAASPDPVDFRHFESIGNIYDRDTNFYYSSDGTEKIHARKNGKSIITNYNYILMENVYGEGYQFGSYESVFSRKGTDGKPLPLFNRKTGTIFSHTAGAWERYDIRSIIENAEQQWCIKIEGKIHIYVSEDDDYYLDSAVKGLKKIIDRKNIGAEVIIYKNRGHDVWTDDLRLRIHKQIDAAATDRTDGK